MNKPDIIIGDMCICTGTIDMVIPDGGSADRQATLRIRKFYDTPVVVASITSPDSNGTMFCLISVKISEVEGDTQIDFWAANVEIGTDSDFKYVLSYNVTGKIK